MAIYQTLDFRIGINDGTKILFKDEWGGEGRPRCRAWDPLNWVQIPFMALKIKGLLLKLLQMPVPLKESENYATQE